MKIFSRKKLIALLFSVIISISLCSCSVADMDFSKKEEKKAPTASNIDSEFNNENIELVQQKASIGEKIYPTSIHSPLLEHIRGEIYVTVNKAEVYDSLKDAGIKIEDVYLPDETLDETYIYNRETDKFINNCILVKVYLTVENVNASVIETERDKKYGEYCFGAQGFGSCGMTNWHLYFDGHGVYGDDVNVCEQYFAMDLEPGETKDIVMAYAVDLNGERLENVKFMTQCQGLATNVDLNLEEIWTDESYKTN